MKNVLVFLLFFAPRSTGVQISPVSDKGDVQVSILLLQKKSGDISKVTGLLFKIFMQTKLNYQLYSNVKLSVQTNVSIVVTNSQNYSLPWSMPSKLPKRPKEIATGNSYCHQFSALSYVYIFVCDSITANNISFETVLSVHIIIGLSQQRDCAHVSHPIF